MIQIQHRKDFLANLSSLALPMHKDRGRQVELVVHRAGLMTILRISLACILYKECVKQVIHIRHSVHLMWDSNSLTELIAELIPIQVFRKFSNFIYYSGLLANIFS